MSLHAGLDSPLAGWHPGAQAVNVGAASLSDLQFARRRRLLRVGERGSERDRGKKSNAWRAYTGVSNRPLPP